MKNKIIIALILIPLIISAGLYLLNFIVAPSVGGNPIGLMGNPESIWFTIIPGGVAVCGLFLTLIIVPLLFGNSFINWKNNNSSWKWQLPLIMLTELIGNIMTLPLEYGVLVAVPLNFIVFGISLGIILIKAGRLNRRSTFFKILVAFAILACAAVVYGFSYLRYL